MRIFHLTSMAASTISRNRSNKTRSNGLFLRGDGTPFIFHLPPGRTRKKLTPLIQQEGGLITSKRQENGICLADDRMGRSASRVKGYFWPSFVVDCVKHNTLLDIEEYRCTRGLKHMRRISGSDNEEEDDGMAPAKAIVIPSEQLDKKGRAKYSKADDINILRYLVRNDQYNMVGGKAVWRRMESLKITSHSAESMRTRYLRFILMNLNSYNIPDNWKSCVTGNISLASGGPTAGHTSLDDDVDGTEAFVVSSSSSSPPAGKQPPSNTESAKTSSKDHGWEDGDDFDQQLFQMAAAIGPADGACKDNPSDTDAASKAESHCDVNREQSDTGSCAKNEVPTPMRNRAGKALHSPSSGSSQLKQKTETSLKRSSSDSSKEKIASQTNAASNSNFMQALGLTPHTELSADDRQKHTKDKQNTGISRYFTRGALKRPPAKSSIEDKPQSSSGETSLKKPLQGKGAQAKMSEKTFSSSPKSKSRKNSSGKPSLQEEFPHYTKSPVELQKQVPVKSSQKTSSIGFAHGAKGSLLRKAGVVMNKQGSGGVPDTSPSITNKDYVTTEDMPRVSSLPSALVEDEEITLSQSLDHLEKGESDMEAMMRFVMTDSTGEDTDQTVVGNGQSQTVHKNKPHEDAADLRTIEVLAREFGLTDSEAMECLWRNSGNVVATRFWILTGQTLPSHWIWSRTQDTVLQTYEPAHPDWQFLERTRGLQAVLDRQRFLLGPRP